MSDQDQKQLEEETLCKKCGTKLTEEDGKLICPSCDTEIDFFGDEEETDGQV